MRLAIANAVGVSEGTVRNDSRPAQDYAPATTPKPADQQGYARPAQDYAPKLEPDLGYVLRLKLSLR